MIHKKTYYSITEVSKMLNIKEHTIRFWDSKLPHLSKRDNKGKTRFFNLKQIDKVVSFMQHKGQKFALMHCVSIYPTENKDMHLAFIKNLINKI